MTLILCTACGHAWIYHEDAGCTELVEIAGEDAMEFCDCAHAGRCDGCVIPPTSSAVRRTP